MQDYKWYTYERYWVVFFLPKNIIIFREILESPKFIPKLVENKNESQPQTLKHKVDLEIRKLISMFYRDKKRQLGESVSKNKNIIIQSVLEKIDSENFDSIQSAIENILLEMNYL